MGRPNRTEYDAQPSSKDGSACPTVPNCNQCQSRVATQEGGAPKTSVIGASAGSTTVSKPVGLSVEFYSRHWGQSGVDAWSLGIESESSSTVTDEEAALMLLTEFHASGDSTGNGTVHAGSPDKSGPFQELLFGIEVEE